jgi:integrase
MYHVRFRIDVVGQEKRAYKSIPICPVSGPGKMTKPERDRRAKEIIAESGADTERHFKQVEGVTSGTTFRQQAERWLMDSRNRKRDPVQPNTIAGWQSHLDTWLLPEFGDRPLASIDNPEGKILVEKMCKAGRSANTVRCVLNVLEWVVASAVDSKGNQLYPRSWNHDFMDVPLVKVEKLRRPTLTGEEVSKIVQAARGRERMRYVLLAAGGLRVGEETALDVRHAVDGGSTVHVQHTVWRHHIGPAKCNSVRDVDLCAPVAALLKTYIERRNFGPLFPTRSGRRESARNARRSFDNLCEKLGLGKRGFHSFRRFRTSVLRADGIPGKDGVPEHLISYWIGHQDPNRMNGHYDFSSKTMKEWRKQWAEKVGVGFEIPADLGYPAPNAPKKVSALTQAEPKVYSAGCVA